VGDRTAETQRRFEYPVMAAALLVVPVIVVEQSVEDDALLLASDIVNWGIWLVFLAELVAILRVTENRWRWLVEHPLEPLVVVLTPPFLPASLQAARVLRLFRLLRLLRVAQIARRMTAGSAVRYASVLAALTVLGGGAAFASAEDTELSTWDGVWWALTTMTTVGYGDLYPHTTAGRLIAMTVMLVGIGFVAILTATIAERFVALQVIEEAGELEEAVAATEDDLLREIREIQERLQSLETSLRGFGRPP
jgi:voltage-gated potassium channel